MTLDGRAETFGQRLVRLRTEAHLTQLELAARLDASESAVREWEHDRRRPHPVRIAGLCRVLHCGRADLLGSD